MYFVLNLCALYNFDFIPPQHDLMLPPCLGAFNEKVVPVDFVDSMDESNYVAVELPKPMGIVFEENDSDFGGIFIQAMKADGVAAKCGVLQEGDQLVAVNSEKVAGMSFDDALGKIVESTGDTTKLVLFRGSAKQLYGPTGASKVWLDEFVGKGGVPASVTEAK